jgi:TRAP-type C4-dicarboxylate transport system permease small subunit
LAPALRAGAHIRVTLLIGFLPPGPRRLAEFVCLITAITLLAYFSWYCANMTWESYVFNDRSPGVLSFPLWIPQLAMSFGVATLTVAFIDDLAAVAQGRVPSYEAATETALESDRLGDSLATPSKEQT